MLDKNDKIIFEHLLHDCRTSIKYLSKITRLKEPSILYKIEKLEKEGYISKYDAILNHNKIFDKTQFIFIRIQEKDKQAFEKEMINTKDVATIYKLINKYNYFLLSNLNNQEEIIKLLNKYTNEYKIETLKSIDFFPFSIFDIPIRYKPKENKKKIQTNKPIKIDEIDKKIINTLIDGGGRKSLLEISKETKINYDTLLYRFKRLKKENFFPLFLAQPGSKKFHIQTDLIILKTKNIEKKDVESKIQITKKCPFIVDLGENKYFTQIFSQSFEEYKLILDKIWQLFDTHLIEIETYNTKEWIILNRHNFEKI